MRYDMKLYIKLRGNKKKNSQRVVEMCVKS